MAKQLLLPNGCRCSQLSVFPRNWNTKKADPNLTWRINYRFYDAAGKSTQRKLAGMNVLKGLLNKQVVTRQLLDNEYNILMYEGYNPIAGKLIRPYETYSEIDPHTPFIDALNEAFKKMKGVPGTLTDIKCTIKGVNEAAKKLGYERVPISMIRRKHITIILEMCAELRTRWSPKRHNKYRAWLMKLFRYLSRVESISHNPVIEVEKLKETRRIREVLTMDQRIKINDYLREKYYHFWRLMQIFFHSGARETEIMKVRTADVDLTRQAFKCLVLKGRQHEWKWRPIPSTILWLWKEVLNECKDGQFLFSKNLKPGDKSIRPDQIGRRWNVKVKKEFGIAADFYSLKHLRTSQVVNELSVEAAARQNAHAGTGMVVKIYDTEKGSREFEQLKNMNGGFV